MDTWFASAESFYIHINILHPKILIEMFLVAAYISHMLRHSAFRTETFRSRLKFVAFSLDVSSIF